MLLKSRAVFALLGALAMPAYAAQELSAVCHDPKGVQYRFSETGKKQRMDDGFTDVTWSFFWNANKPADALAITQSSKSAGGAMERHPGFALAQDLPDMITIITPLKGATWVYALYPMAGLLIASRTGVGYQTEVAVGGVFTANCTFSVQ